MIECACYNLRSWVKFFKVYLGPSPCDWRTMINWTVVQTIFHNDHISQGLCKIVWTKFHVLLFSNCGSQIWKSLLNMSHFVPIFRTFSPQLENNDTFNLVPTILHKPWDMWSLWKFIGTAFQCIIVLQSLGEGVKQHTNVVHPGSQSATYPPSCVTCKIQLFCAAFAMDFGKSFSSFLCS